MIIHALCDYYKRLQANSESNIAPEGFSSSKIHAEIVLDKEGNLIEFNDIRRVIGKKKTPKLLIVPQEIKRSGSRAFESPNFMWDNTGFVLGKDNKGKDGNSLKAFQCFKDYHSRILGPLDDEGAKAVIEFLSTWNPAKALSLKYWDELAGMNVVFRLDGHQQYIHDRPAIKKAWTNFKSGSGTKEGSSEDKQPFIAFCLVSGKKDAIARIHASIKGVQGSQTSGAAIVSFNLDSFCSYNKEKSYNAPISESAAFAYTTALNHLLNSDSHQRIQIGDTTTVFWTEKESSIESFMGMIFDPRDDAASNQEVQLYLKAVKGGRKPDNLSPEMQFFILGLSPNASRLSVRFWHVSTVGDINEKLGQHFRDLEIVRPFDTDPEYPGMWQLLKQTARETKDISPLLAGSLMRSILEGTLYPNGLLAALINRIRADQTINYLRAALIKAILNRKQRLFKQGLEVSMSLNKDDTRPAYLCGRLFAVLEKGQKDAIPGANSTIKDRFFGAASATPRTVFPQLLRLTQHHIGKSDYGFAIDKMIEDILGNLQEFPAHLSLEDQGFFTIGYYHQRQNFYAKKETN